MTSHMRDVLLVGYGAVGAIYAHILKKSGKACVTVVARSNYEAANAHGLHIQSGKYGNIKGWRPDRIFKNVSQALDRPYSYVVVTSKAIPELTRTPTLLEPLLSSSYSDQHPQPTYVIMQNGLNVEVDLYEALKKLKSTEEPRIISTAVWIGTGMLDSTTVQHNEFDRVSLGVYRPTPTVTSNTPEEDALLREFADILAAGGSETTIVPEIQRVKFAKNIWNACLGITAALARFPLTAIFRPPQNEPGASANVTPLTAPASAKIVPVEERTPSQAATAALPAASPEISAYTIPVIYDAMQEINALGTALFGEGALAPDVAEKTITNTSRIHERPEAKHRASTLVDVENGRPTEVEVILGELVRMGRKHGVPMPRIETFYALLLIIQNQLLRQYREKKPAL
ncbi:hypothetical protein WOLCODRAFT_140904 [Wolfiporia cocos MD-104 SS10]|uniref:6-phosphogluconate dehydrogenase C-terminal domain-like protein n=1 Tax=Wolfiporia cocos (strain MD-104) TaxID=742152 RepID=A0A2H3JLJ8_WOLCO|nr:hypothetical protein WOLCODRAFT_140904 [Wolfiporia cocos MD-104 SS10]